MDEMISFFNQEVSKMDISQENKMKLLGMITAIGYESKKQEVVRCKECKFCMIHNQWCKRLNKMTNGNWFCAAGERKEQDDEQTI